MTADEQFEAVLDPAGHLDDATIAGLDAEAFPDDVAARLRAHVAGCATCRAKLTGIGAVRSQLAALPTPTMPDPVLARLRQTIRDEHARRAAAASSAGFPTPFTPAAAPPPAGPPMLPPGVVDLQAARARRARRAKWVSGIAAAVVAVAAGIVIGVHYGGSHETGGNLAGEAPPSSTATAPGGVGEPAPNGSGLPELTTQALTSDLASIVAQAQLGAGNAQSTEGAMSNSALRAACTSELGVDKTPIAVLHATVDGKDAYVFVFPTDTDHKADVYVVGDSCGLGQADQLFHGTGSY
jgi:hypothetical protein